MSTFNAENNSLAERIAYFLEHNQITNADCSKLTGVSEVELQNICKGISKPSTGFLVKLLDNYDLNSDWLLLGRGEMTDKINIHIKIFEQKKPLAMLVNPQDEEIYRKSAQLINDCLKQNRLKHPFKENEELLSLALMQFALKSLRCDDGH